MIKEFIKLFSDKEIEGIVKQGKEFYLVSKEAQETRDKIDMEPFSQGIFLGKMDGKKFNPSPALIEEISKISDQKIFVNEKTAWLFICGRDIYGKGVIKANVSKGLVLVQSEQDENLGYGKVVGDIANPEKIVVNNILDKGHYLRMEKKRKS